MLEESLRTPVAGKQIWLAVEQPGLKAFLEGILREWHYEPCSHPVDGAVLLAEEGAVTAPPHQQVIWLSSSPYAASGRLQLPFHLTELYALLERCYHNPPRRHLRLALNAPVEVGVAGHRSTTMLTSLSDRGCRLSFDNEVAREVPVEVCGQLNGIALNLTGKVIYCVPRRAADGRLSYDLGLLFAEVDREQRQELLDYIVASFIAVAQRSLAAADFAAAMNFLSLSDRVRSHLRRVAGV